VVLLAAIRDVFDARHVDRITSKDLVTALLEQDDMPWSEWRGVHGDQNPRRLSQGELAKALAPFGIKSRTVWRYTDSKRDTSGKGYHRHQFEDAWASYCSEGDTTAQANNIKRLVS
jgi:putative DNA primase/helicase